MKAFSLFCCCLGLGVALAACSKEEPPAAADPAPVATPAPVAPTAEAPAASATAAVDASEPATEEDFEDEAAKQVTAATLDSQLDALEKEIQAD